MREGAYIYILSNWNNQVIYIGVTNDLRRRVAEHIAKINDGFPEKYNCTKLVYFEAGESMTAAIEREKQLKNWKRSWKNELINKENPEWVDLSEGIGVTQEYIKAVAASYRRDSIEGLYDLESKTSSQPQSIPVIAPPEPLQSASVIAASEQLQSAPVIAASEPQSCNRAGGLRLGGRNDGIGQARNDERGRR